MKYFIIIISILFLFSCQSNPKTETVADNTTVKTDTTSPEKDIKPNPEIEVATPGKDNFIVSKFVDFKLLAYFFNTGDFDDQDRLIHFQDGTGYRAEVDTIVYFTQDKKKQALVFVLSYPYEGDQLMDCHACAPMGSVGRFEQVEDGWELVKFERDCKCVSGSYGEGAAFEGFQQYGFNRWGFYNSGYYLAQGIQVETVFFYDGMDFRRLFEIEKSGDNNGAALDTDKNYEYFSKINIYGCDEDYCPIEVTYSGTKYAAASREVYSVDGRVEKYIYNKNTRIYEMEE